MPEIDHVLGRPSVKFRKIQVLAVVSFWSFYLYKGNRNGPPIIRRLSALLSKRLTTWQTLVITLLWFYVARNFGKLVGLECPEPLANLYSRSYFRATWVTTALDAGFWSAMRIRRKWLRDFLSMVFSVYYMFCAEQADEKVRKIRGTLTVDHLRVSWNKGTTPYLAFFTSLLRPRLMRYSPRAIRIPRPQESSYKEPVHAWLYFDGPLSTLKKHTKVVLDIPGGGFVAMDPRNHDDKLFGWAGKTGLPVLSLDYKKAPEYPYPYALNECYDVYHTLVASRGRCIGLSGEHVPKIVVSGDSAGGNLAVGMVLMVLQSGSTDTRRWQGERELPPPTGVVLVYPALDMNIGNWMTDEQMALIRDRRSRKTNQGILRRKSDDYRHLAPNTPRVSDDENEDEDEDERTISSPNTDSTVNFRHETPATSTIVLKSTETMIRLSAAHTNKDSTIAAEKAPSTVITAPSSTPAAPTDAIPTPAPPAHALKTRLAMSSMISYFNDRILTPEMMRAMIILYIGPHNRPDFSTDFLLSPLLAPESLLAKFPKTYFLTGERDPLVDDTRAAWVDARELGLEWARRRAVFREEDAVEVALVPGISHGFLQFVGVFPEGWKYIFRCARWMSECFAWAEAEEAAARAGVAARVVGKRDREIGALGGRRARTDYFGEAAGLEAGASAGLVKDGKGRWRHHRRSGTSSADEDMPLEMTVRGSVGKGKGMRDEFGEEVVANGSVSARGRRVARTAKSRRKSLASLASEDDLLGRRMKGLTGGLMGMVEDGVPPTP
ncbi:alpha/beta-hydrolase [Glonium stellatum]|uniref:Alpha/beta-hydrolase n=1 Tax=Glonium stellatum TaxID=574774 RepID=A0A8E2EWG1_9PEZI|nr:alpha/beta-hydrolase [Glonium stellatum]